MLLVTLTKVFSAVAVVGAIATGAFVLVPPPTSTHGVWLDTPLDNATVDEGDVRVVLHSDLPNITTIYVDVVLGGSTVATLRDSDLELVRRGAGAEALTVFDQIWTIGDPGVYTLTVSVSGSTATMRSFTVTVLDESAVSVDTAEGNSGPTPTTTPTATPTATATAEPVPAAPSGPLIAGSVNRFQPGDDDWQNYFYLNTFSPAEAATALEVRITDTLNGVTGDWQSYPCSPNTSSGNDGLYNCVVANHMLQPPASFQIDGTWLPFTVEFRGVITSGGETVYAPGGSWMTARRSA